MSHQVSAVADLKTPTARRRQRHAQRIAEGRAAADRTLAMADFLSPPDRALLRAVYADGLTTSALAHVSGQSRTAMHRRLAMLLERIASPDFACVIARRSSWPARRALVAQLCIIEGLSMRAAAEHMSVSVHVIRSELIAIRSLGGSCEADLRAALRMRLSA